MTDKERDRIECAIRHIQTAVDVDPWAAELAVAAMKAQLSREDTTSDCISRKGLKESLLSEDYETHDYCFPCKEIMKRIDEQPPTQPDHIADGNKKGDHLREVTKMVDTIKNRNGEEKNEIP